MNQNICGPVIKRLREEAGMTQTELARRLRALGRLTTQRRIKAMEEGTCRIRAQEIVLFSKIFSIPLDLLFAWEQEPGEALPDKKQ